MLIGTKYMKKLVVQWVGSVLLTTLLMACGHRASAPVAESDTDGPYSVESVLASSDTLDYFLFSDDEDMMRADTAAFRLMNRIMQMSAAYYELENPPFDEHVYFWKWMEASNREVERFRAVKQLPVHVPPTPADVQEAILAVYGLLSDYSIGAQSEMNTAFYVFSVMAHYAALHAYGYLYSLMPDSLSARTVMRDYVTWSELSATLFGLYGAAIIGTEQYSAAPLESNSVYEALMQCRMDGLREELKLAAGRPTAAIAGQYEWVKDADFERQLEGYLQADDYYKDPSADSLAQAVIPALHRWLEVRREREARFDGETRAAFGNETQRMRYALLRLLMNGMSYNEPVDSLCYTFRIASSSTLTEKEGYDSYIYDEGRYVYFTGRTWSDPSLLEYDRNEVLRVYPDAYIATIRNGKLVKP